MHQKYLKNIFPILLLVTPILVSAAEWIPSAVVAQPQFRNPWILKSATANYCFQGEKVSGRNLELLRPILKEVFSFWSKELSQTQEKDFNLGQQNWVEIACDSAAKVDVIFSLGVPEIESARKVLRDLGNPKSLTLNRTDYDKENMRVQGMIFLSDLVVESLNDNKQKDLVRFTLTHELGYVFGFRGKRWGLEPTSFTDWIFKYPTKIPEQVPTLLLPQVDFISCLPNSTCFQIKGPNFEDRYFVFRKKDGNLQVPPMESEEGFIVFEKNNSQLENSVTLIEVFLPKGQTLFTDFAGNENHTVPILRNWIRKGAARFYKKEKAKDFLSVFATLTPYSLHAVHGGGKKTQAKLIYNLDVLQQPWSMSSGRNPSGEGILNPKRKAEIYIRERDVKKAQDYLQQNTGSNDE